MREERLHLEVLLDLHESSSEASVLGYENKILD